MNKKTLICICVFVFVLSVMAGAAAELTNISNQTEGVKTVIYYVPATNNADVMLTAKVVAKAIVARWTGRAETLFGKYNSTKALQTEFKDDTLKSVFSKGTDDGGSQLNAKIMPAGYESAACDIWFIVPQEAQDTFIRNEALIGNCRQLLTNEASLLHVIFIGDSAKSLPADCALGQLAAEGRVDWICMATDFRLQSISPNADSALHNGYYLLASLFGQPVDLAVTPADDSSWIYDLPESSKALVLFDWTDKAGKAEIRDAAGNPCDISEFSFTEKGYAVMSGLQLSRREAGTYSITVTEGSFSTVRVYWYPDLGEIAPAFRLEDVWKRGENEVGLSVGKIIGKQENYIVQFIYEAGNDEAGATTSSPDGYDPDNLSWYKTYLVRKGTEHVSLRPYLRVNMDDGNRILEWTEEKNVRDVQSEGVNVRSDAPAEVTVYASADGKGSKGRKFTWSDFFIYNDEDQPEFSALEVNPPENKGLALGDQPTGFDVKPKEGKDLAESLTVMVKAVLNGEEKTTEVVFTRRNYETLYDEILFTSEQEGKEISAGSQVTVSVEIPEETMNNWRAACKQVSALPKPETLRFYCALDGEEDGEGSLITGEEAEPSRTVTVPVLTKGGKVNIQARILAEDGETVIAGKPVSVTVRNDAPEYSAREEMKQKVCLKGFPWGYQKEESLLKACFGTDVPFDLYEDREDNLTSVTFTVENLQGLELPDYGNVTGDSWTYEVQNREDPVEISVTEPGDHVIKVTASDGVNQSEPYEAKVKVYSEVLQYVSYAVAGLAALLLLVVIALIIRYASKPSFENIRIRCYASSDEDQETSTELMGKSDSVSMQNFKKKGVLLSTLLILCRQPGLGKEYAKVAEDITVVPAKHNGISILYGKEAMKTIGRHEKRENVAQGDQSRMRIGNVYILIRNEGSDDA